MYSCALLVLSLLSSPCHGFVVLTPRISLVSTVEETTAPREGGWTELSAAKRRRRRKDAPLTGGEEEGTAAASEGDDELPDFDLVEDTAAEVFLSEEPLEKMNAPAPVSGSPNDVTPAMMGSAKQQQKKSIRELLNDRSLEKQLRFDDPDSEPGEDLPSFADFAKRAASGPPPAAGPAVLDSGAGLGKKAKREARVAAAIARQEEQEREEDSLVSKLQGLGEGTSPLKILENGTWVGIGILVAWEVYINSPFFERAAPMAPVVFENVP